MQEIERFGLSQPTQLRHASPVQRKRGSNAALSRACTSAAGFWYGVVVVHSPMVQRFAPRCMAACARIAVSQAGSTNQTDAARLQQCDEISTGEKTELKESRRCTVEQRKMNGWTGKK